MNIIVLALLLLAWAAPLHAAPEGSVTWGAHVSLAARWLDPADTEGTIIPFMVLYALHDALVKPMPAGSRPQHVEPGRIVDDVEGRPRL